MRKEPELGRHDALELCLRLERRVGSNERDAARDPENVGVDRDRGLPEGHVEDDGSRLAAYSRQALQDGPDWRHDATVLLHEPAREGDVAAGLGVEEV